MGDAFMPVFTPPWNRCSSEALDLLSELGYSAVSRFGAKQPMASKGLPDLFANVDLHTRKEKSAKAGWDSLFEELKQAIFTGHCGIMIHHQRMNKTAFEFLDLLLTTLLERKDLRLVHFGHMTKSVKYES